MAETGKVLSGQLTISTVDLDAIESSTNGILRRGLVQTMVSFYILLREGRWRAFGSLGL